MGEPSICVNDTDAESGMARLGKIPLPDGCLGTLPCPRLTRNPLEHNGSLHQSLSPHGGASPWQFPPSLMAPLIRNRGILNHKRP